MKKIKLILYTWILLTLFPCMISAYSDYVVLGGENIGIHIDTPGVMIIGFYKVNGEFQKGDPEIQVGDYITKVNNKEIHTINELTDSLESEIKNNQVTLTLLRNKVSITTVMTLEQVDGVYKTGLYVKDGITGIGTLSYIDPGTKIYGALGHEVLESTSGKLVEVKTGSIYESTVTSIRKSTNGNAGEKNAELNYNHIYGDIKENTNKGIFGIYKEEIQKETVPVGKKEDIKVGEALIYTVLDGKVKKDYKIEITNINEYNEVKNITFKITDEELLNKTGGIVQGMSGSPIVQDGHIIGAVTHVIIDNPITGYGIFITTMLENGDTLKDR